VATLKRHITHVSLSRGQTLFTLGDTIDNLYIIESGRLTLEWPMVGARADNAAEGGPCGGLMFWQVKPRDEGVAALDSLGVELAAIGGLGGVAVDLLDHDVLARVHHPNRRSPYR
jgi:hypothetical protein